MAPRQAQLALGALESLITLSRGSIMRSCGLCAPKGVGRPSYSQGSCCAPAPLLPRALCFMAAPPHLLLRHPRHLNFHTSSRNSTIPCSMRATQQHSAVAPPSPRGFSSRTDPKLPDVVGQQVEFEGVVTLSDDRSAKIEVTSDHWEAMRPHFFSRRHPPLKSKYTRRALDCGVRVFAHPRTFKEGQSCRVIGTYIWNEYFGLAVRLSRCIEVQATSKKAILSRLQSVSGIGPKTAERIYECLGLETVSVLDAPDAVDWLLRAGYGKQPACKKLKSAWDAEKEAHRQEDFLPSLGLKPQECRALQQQYGQDCEAALHSDPYLALLRPSSIDLSLRMADEVAANLGVLEQHIKITATPGVSSSTPASQASIDSSSPSRGAVAMIEALLSQASRSGNSFVRWSALEQAALKHLRNANDHLLNRMPALSGNSNGSLLSPEQSSLDEEGEGEVVWEDAAHTLPPGAHSNEPQLWASILMGLRRVVMEVHTADPLSPPLPISQPYIPPFARTIPPDILGISSDASQSKAKAFPKHAIAYLDLLHRAEVEVADRLSQMLLAGQTACLARRLQALEAIGEGQAPGSEEERRRAMAEADASAVDEALRVAHMLSDRQRLAVQLASHAPVMLLTGAAGCGKTFVTQAIVNMWLRQGKRVLLCAPTGRAAQLLQERVVHQTEGGSNNINASTIHRLLGYRARRQDQQQQDQQQQQQQHEWQQQGWFPSRAWTGRYAPGRGLGQPVCAQPAGAQDEPTEPAGRRSSTE
uniref:Uncharacterized protein n=1 Tax=Dunaliella tertiolecta TaxID=3047 RepID=A0A7S3VL64_DUNTE